MYTSYTQLTRFHIAVDDSDCIVNGGNFVRSADVQFYFPIGLESRSQVVS